MERWHLNQDRTIAPAPYAKYKGDRSQAFWCFDEEMAEATQNYSADQPGKLPQLISLTDGHQSIEKGCGEPVNLGFYPDRDGITFHLKTAFMDVVPGTEKNKNPARWTYLTVGTPLGHATEGGPIVIHKIVGPVKKVSADTFALSLERNAETNDGRLMDIWLWARHPGDDRYKSIVQQAVLRVKPNTVGADQHITFPPIPFQVVDRPDAAGKEKRIELAASSDNGLPVHYYVREGPAEIDEENRSTLVIKAIPPRRRFPIEVTVVAWQWGRSADPAIKNRSSRRAHVPHSERITTMTPRENAPEREKFLLLRRLRPSSESRESETCASAHQV